MTFQYVIDADKPIAVKKILLVNLSSSENKKSSTSFLFISYISYIFFFVTRKFLSLKKIWF